MLADLVVKRRVAMQIRDTFITVGMNVTSLCVDFDNSAEIETGNLPRDRHSGDKSAIGSLQDYAAIFPVRLEWNFAVSPISGIFLR